MRQKWKEKIARSLPAWSVGGVIVLGHFIDSKSDQLKAFIIDHLGLILLCIVLVCVVMGFVVYEWKLKLEKQIADLDEKATAIIERLDD